MNYIDNVQQVVEAFPQATPFPTYDQGRMGVSRVQVAPNDACSWRVTLTRPAYTFPSAPTTMTVRCNSTGGGSDQFFPILARVTWGARGVRHSADIDWQQGRSFVVHGSFVEVEAIIDQRVVIVTVGGQTPTPQPPRVLLGASIVPCGAGVSGDDAPTRSLTTGTLAAEQFVIIPVPAYARRLRWHPTDRVNPSSGGVEVPFTIASFDLPAGTVPWNSDSHPALNQGAFTTSQRTWPPGGWLTLPDGARFIRITNAMPAASPELVVLNIEFALSLG